MVLFVQFTIILIPFLIGVLLIFGQILCQKRRHLNFSTLTNSLILHPIFPHNFRPKNMRTTVEEKKELKPLRRKGSLQNLSMAEAQRQGLVQKETEAQRQGLAQKEAEAQTTLSQPSSPMSPFKKSASTRVNCLCSPTTHVGSFRCRLHRHGNKPGFRRGHSVEGGLCDLATKLNSKPSLASSSLQMH